MTSLLSARHSRCAAGAAEKRRLARGPPTYVIFPRSFVALELEAAQRERERAAAATYSRLKKGD